MLAKMIEILNKTKESELSALQVIGLELTGNINGYAPFVVDTMNTMGIRMMFLRDLPHWEHVEKLSYSEIADRMREVLFRWQISGGKPTITDTNWRLRWSWKMIADMLKMGLPQEYRALKIGDKYNYAGAINQVAFGTPYLYPLPVIEFDKVATKELGRCYGIITKLAQYNERKFTFGEMAEMIEFQFCDNSLFTQTFDFTYCLTHSDW